MSLSCDRAQAQIASRHDALQVGKTCIGSARLKQSYEYPTITLRLVMSMLSTRKQWEEI